MLYDGYMLLLYVYLVIDGIWLVNSVGVYINNLLLLLVILLLNLVVLCD